MRNRNAFWVCLLAVLGCSAGGAKHPQNGATPSAMQDGGAASGSNAAGSGGRSPGASGTGDQAAAGSAAAGDNAATCVPADQVVAPAIPATPSAATDQLIDVSDQRGARGSLVADGAGGVWMLANEPLRLDASPTGVVQLRHYGHDGALISTQALHGDLRWDPNLLLIGGSAPRLAGLYGKTLDLGTSVLGDGNTPTLFVATLADDGPVLEAELRFPSGSDPLTYNLIAGARDDAGRVLLALDSGASVPDLPCAIGQLAVVGFDGADVGMHACLDGAEAGQGALAVDGAGGAYVVLQGAVARVSNTGTEQWRFALEQSSFGATIAVLAQGDDGVVFAGSFAGNLHVGSETFEAGNNGRDLLLCALHADGTQAWARSFAARGNADPAALERLADGSLLLAGTFEDALDIGDGVLVSEASREPSGASERYADAVVLQLDRSGAALGAERVGAAEADRARTAVSDGAGGAWLYLMRPDQHDAAQLVHVTLADAHLPPALDRSGDPLTHIAAPPGFAQQQFGRSIAVDGDVAVVGRTLHVLHRTADGFAVGEQIERPDDATSTFAESLALSSRVLAVADPGTAFDGALGRVYVYRRDGDHFIIDGRLQPAEELADNDDFGRAIALVGDMLFVASNRGVYMFEHAGARWIERDKLVGPSDRRFYQASNAQVLASDGERLFVGMPDERIERLGDGAVYVYGPHDGEFTLEQRLVASDPLPFAAIPREQCSDGAIECGELDGRGFGAGLTVDGTQLVVGADRGTASPAELYVFERKGTDFHELGKLRVRYQGNASSLRAMPMLLLGSRVLLGSPQAGVRAAWYAGSAELLPLTPTADDAITFGTELHSIDPSAGGYLGSALARSGDQLLIGAPTEHGGEVLAVQLPCE